MIKIIYIYLLIIFFNCASQAPPQGGPRDIEGPILLGIQPNNKSNISMDNPIVLSFDEYIDPSSIVNSVYIYPSIDVSIRVRQNKIVIKPLNKWPVDSPVEINLSRNISDHRTNKINEQIQLIYNINDSAAYGSIKGELLNSLEGIHNIYLYNWPMVDVDNPIKKVNSDINNNFSFNYLEFGKYVIVASEGHLDVNQNRYGICTDDYVELDNGNIDESILIYIDDPLEKVKISRVETVNSNLLNIFYNNNLSRPYILDSLVGDNDSIYINIAENNRLQKYDLEPYLYLGKTVLDTISPNIVSVNEHDSLAVVNFSEPINTDSLIVLGLHYDSIDNENWMLVEYESLNSMTVQLLKSNLQAIKISGDYVQDFSQNKMLDSIKVYTLSHSPINKTGSKIMGKITNSINQNIVVAAQNISLNLLYHDVADDSLFAFEDLEPGKYILHAYEQKNTINPLIYFSGTLDPYQSAAQFSIYKDTIEVRKFWDTEGINIEF